MKTRIKAFITTVCIGSLLVSAGFTATEVADKKESPQSWRSDDGDVTFSSDGAITTAAKSSITAATVSGDGTLIVHFSNEPTIGAEPASSKYHILATSTNSGLVSEFTAIGISTTSSLKFPMEADKFPCIAAISNGEWPSAMAMALDDSDLAFGFDKLFLYAASHGTSTTGNVVRSTANALAITQGSNASVSMGSASDLTAVADSTSSGTPNSTASQGSANVIGISAAASGDSSLALQKISVFGKSNNTLASTAKPSSNVTSDGVVDGAANAIGVSSGFSNGVLASNVNAEFNRKNKLVSVAESSAADSGATQAAANVIGVGIGRNYVGKVEMAHVQATFGQGNGLVSITKASSAKANAHAASNIIGAGIGENVGAQLTLSDVTAAFGPENRMISIAVATDAAAGNSYSAAGVVGIALAHCDDKQYCGNANAIAVNLSGDQTVVALAGAASNGTAQLENVKVNVFGADNTDKDGSYGWRVGIYNEDTKASTANILGAKINSTLTLPSGSIDLVGDQGSDSGAAYAKAFALGNDFKIYIGGKVNGSNTFDPVANTMVNTVNIFGAIAKAQNSSGTSGSSLTIADKWQVNVYGPLQDLAEIKMLPTGTSQENVLNVYGLVKNVTIDGGAVAIYGHQGTDDDNSHGRIELKGNSVLFLRKADDAATTNFDNALSSIKDIINTVTTVSAITSNAYPWKPSITTGGSLNLATQDRLVMHVDSTQKSGQLPDGLNLGTTLKKSNACVVIDSNVSFMKLNGGKIILQNDGNNGILPEGTSYLIAYGLKENVPPTTFALTQDGDEPALSPVGTADRIALGIDEISDATLTFQKVTKGSFMEVANTPYEIGLYYFGPASASSFKYAGLVAAIVDSKITEPVACESGELAYMAVDATNTLTNAIITRRTSVKGSVADPFVYIFGGHTHRNRVISGGLGCSSDIYGIAVGIDKVYSSDDGILNLGDNDYVRIGGVIGYVNTDSRLSGSIYDRSRTSEQEMCAALVFGAYETFNEKHLKTNINATVGVGHIENKLHRVDHKFSPSIFDAKVKSYSAFANAEFVKNMCACRGFHFGLWTAINYNRVCQDSYSESAHNPSDSTIARHFDKLHHNFLDTIVGINIEKEIQSAKYSDAKLRILCRAGWDHQNHDHSDVKVYVAGLRMLDEFTNFGCPAKNSAVVVLSLTGVLDRHWSFVGSWTGRFNKDMSNNVVTCGIEYDF